MERYYPIRTEEKALHIKPGREVTLAFDGRGKTGADRLHFTGEVCQFYQWKNEPDHPMLYRRIDDSLNTKEADLSQYCLDLSADNYDYPILAYHKLLFPPKLSYLRLKDYTDCWTFGLRVKAKNLTVREGGYLRFRAEVRYKREGVDPHSLKADPDLISDLLLPEGTYGWSDLCQDLVFDAKNTASVCLFLEGERYSGTLYAERPFLQSESGWNLLPEFEPNSAERPQFTWTGWNLSKKEWPKFEMSLNGEVFFRGEIFERCHRRSEGEILLNGAKIREGENSLTVRLISDYRDPLAYDLYDVALLGWDDTFLVACPEIVSAKKPFALFVEGKKDTGVRLISDRIKAVDLKLSQEGLNAILLQCDEPCNDLCFSLEYQGKTEVCNIRRCLLKEEDGVTTGTGDQVYVRNTREETEAFLKWYFSNQIGNLVTLRPTYRWSGIRSPKDEEWKRMADLFNKAGIQYVHMADGRELPGCDCNPTTELLQGDCFMGKQNHEWDGAISYWGLLEHTNNPSQQAFLDLLLRRYKTHGERMCSLRPAPAALIEQNGRRLSWRDLSVPDDMEALAEASVQMLAACRNGATRHTGPSTLFKYFYQAGYDWTGAELMYGPQETVCAALRGAAKAYGKPVIGAHHAIQWSSTPHDSPEKNKRYRLALFGTYLQGVHDINTEEGLWHVEEFYAAYNRFSNCCKNHLKEQRDFYRYVQTHSRTGEFHTPIAFLHGRFDAWKTFNSSPIWGRPHLPYEEAEYSWKLLNYFYPRNVQNALYFHPTPKESVGYYSGTPYGNVDVLPIESADYSDYKLLVAPGYNKAVKEDLDKLQAFTEEGGILLLGWPQCTETTRRSDVVSLNHTYSDHPFARAIRPKGEFVRDTYAASPVTVCDGPLPQGAVPLLSTEEGRTLAYSLPVGRGKVLFVNAKEYAGNEGILAAYRELLDKTVPAVLQEESVYGIGDDAIQFTLYRQPDGSKHLYFMATDWYNDDPNPRRGRLMLEGICYEIPAPMGTPVKVVTRKNTALWCEEGEGDVLSLTEDSATVQGYGTVKFTLAKQGSVRTLTADFTQQAVQTLSL